MKLVQLITCIAKYALVDVLKGRLPGANFGYCLNGMKNRISPMLDNQEQQLLYPDNSHYKGDLTDLDISLIYIILRNLHTICPHMNGWGINPNDDDMSLSANIERIRIFNNKYVSHFSELSINDDNFLTTWEKIRQCIIAIGGPKYMNQIDILLTSEINPNIEIELINTLQKLRENETRHEMNTTKFKGMLVVFIDYFHYIPFIEKVSKSVILLIKVTNDGFLCIIKILVEDIICVTIECKTM